MKSKGIILLSGGLDSVVSLSCEIAQCDIKLALTFDYGQKSFLKEKEASEKIAKFYNIEHKIIKLDWLKEITKTSLVSNEEVPQLNIEDLKNKEITRESCKNVWVPNRNGLFINIAAAFADTFDYNKIIIGANKEEAAEFSDNSKEFIEGINQSLKYSTMKQVSVSAPLIDFDKEEIIKKGLESGAPLEMINSCYSGCDSLHCGRCESCLRLKRALSNLGETALIQTLFK